MESDIEQTHIDSDYFNSKQFKKQIAKEKEEEAQNWLDWMEELAEKEDESQLERNFCPRCGKRTNDIHTCTPPQRTEPVGVMVSMDVSKGDEPEYRIFGRIYEVMKDGEDEVTYLAIEGSRNFDIPPQRPKVVFPTMLRKMWSGGEVQAWLDENVNKENK